MYKFEFVDKHTKKYHDYLIKDNGEIYSLISNKTRKVSYERSHPWINLIIDGKNKVHMVYKLIAEAFAPNPNGYLHINHKDGNRLNNHSSNLEWVSHIPYRSRACYIGDKYFPSMSQAIRSLNYVPTGGMSKKLIEKGIITLAIKKEA